MELKNKIFLIVSGVLANGFIQGMNDKQMDMSVVGMAVEQIEKEYSKPRKHKIYKK